ncbi:hypothetical protein BJ875DRAFT_341573, partial [Amylocarpus encephaloides]
INSTSPIHLSSVHINGLKFWVGKETATYCPDVVPSCPNGTQTQVGVSTGSDTVYANTIVPGGQAVYVAGDGSLSVTVAHSGSTGENGLRAPFQYTPQAGEDDVGSLDFNDLEWAACPNGEEGVYQIFADGSPNFDTADHPNCIGIALGPVISDSQSVWQY